MRAVVPWHAYDLVSPDQQAEHHWNDFDFDFDFDAAAEVFVSVVAVSAAAAAADDDDDDDDCGDECGRPSLDRQLRPWLRYIQSRQI